MIKMPDTKTMLLAFPLFVMVMVSIISLNLTGAGAFSGGATIDEFGGVRDVTDDQVSYFENFILDLYDDFGPIPWNFYEEWLFLDCDVGSCSESFTDELNDVFGDEFDEGHRQLAGLMLDIIENAAPENITENDVRYVISRDPQHVEEFREIEGSSISYSSIIGFVGMFVGIAILVGIIGIRIFGIGLADTSISTIMTITVLLLLWTFLSVTAYSHLAGIPILGPILWVLLTFMYLAGALFFMMGD